jgi:hypothetical protein
VFYRISDVFYGIGPPIFILAYVRRFEPTYAAFGKQRVLVFLRVLYGIVITATVFMLSAAMSASFRRWDIDVDPTEDTTSLSDFENQTYAFYGITIMLVNICTTAAGARFVSKKLTEIKKEMNQNIKTSKHVRSLYWTFLNLILNLITTIIFALSSLGDILPNWMALPLPIRSQTQSWLIQMYFSFMMMAMIMFTKSIQKNSYQTVKTSVATSWVASDLHSNPSSQGQQSNLQLQSQQSAMSKS